MLLNEWGPLNTWQDDEITGGGSGGKRPHGAAILPPATYRDLDQGFTDEELIAIAITAIQVFYDD